MSNNFKFDEAVIVVDGEDEPIALADADLTVTNELDDERTADLAGHLKGNTYELSCDIEMDGPTVECPRCEIEQQLPDSAMLHMTNEPWPCANCRYPLL